MKIIPQEKEAAHEPSTTTSAAASFLKWMIKTFSLKQDSPYTPE